MDQDDRQLASIRVFILDDHEIFRRGIQHLFAAEPDINVVGEAATASSALARMPALCPDIAILDVRLPDGDGVTVCREIRSAQPKTACLMARLRERIGAVDPVEALSAQEHRVLDLIGDGLTNREIAQHMFLAEKTVKNYVSALLAKLGMHHRSQAAALAARRAETATSKL